MIGYKKKQEQQNSSGAVATDSVQITSKKEKTGKKGYEFRVQKGLLAHPSFAFFFLF